MRSSGENPRGGGGGIEVASRQICRMRLFAHSPHCIILYFFGLLRARPTVLHTTLNGHLDTGVPPAALVYYNIVGIYIILSWIFRIVYTNTFGRNECVVGINGTARFIISFALTPNRTHGVPCIIFFFKYHIIIVYHLQFVSSEFDIIFFLLTKILI